MIAALKHSDAAVRRKAASALSFAFLRPEMLEERFEPALIEALNDTEDRVRMSVASSLGHAKGEASLDALIAATTDKSNSVKAAAARSLGYRKDTRGIEALAVAASDKNDEVMAPATAALESLSFGHPIARKNIARLIRMFRSGGHSNFLAAQALGEIGTPEAIEELMHGLDSKEEMVRHFALMGLVHCRKIDRIGPIVRCLHDKSSHVRMMAIGVLEQAAPDQAPEYIAHLLDDEDRLVRIMAAGLLMRKGDPRADRIVEQATRSEDERERSWAEAMMSQRASAL